MEELEITVHVADNNDLNPLEISANAHDANVEMTEPNETEEDEKDSVAGTAREAKDSHAGIAPETNKKRMNSNAGITPKPIKIIKLSDVRITPKTNEKNKDAVAVTVAETETQEKTKDSDADIATKSSTLPPEKITFDFQRKLIAEVQKHPVLYDAKHKCFSNETFKEDVWHQISCKLSMEMAKCLSTWAELRYKYQRHTRRLKHFIRQRKANKHARKRPIMLYEEDLLFLYPHVARYPLQAEKTKDAQSTMDLCNISDRASESSLKEEPTIKIKDMSVPMLTRAASYRLTDEIVRLIGCVRAYPQLYDPHNRNYENYRHRGLIWGAIANELKDKATKLMKVWLQILMRYEWETLYLHVPSPLKKKLYFMRNLVADMQNSVCRSSNYLQDNWHDPIDHFRTVMNLINILKGQPELCQLVEDYIDSKKKPASYHMMWNRVGKAVNCSVQRCEVTWLLLRKFYIELSEMRKAGYQLQDKWYFENIIASLYRSLFAHSKQINVKRPSAPANLISIAKQNVGHGSKMSVPIVYPPVNKLPLETSPTSAKLPTEPVSTSTTVNHTTGSFTTIGGSSIKTLTSGTFTTINSLPIPRIPAVVKAVPPKQMSVPLSSKQLSITLSKTMQLQPTSAGSSTAKITKQVPVTIISKPSTSETPAAKTNTIPTTIQLLGNSISAAGSVKLPVRPVRPTIQVTMRRQFRPLVPPNKGTYIRAITPNTHLAKTNIVGVTATKVSTTSAATVSSPPVPKLVPLSTVSDKANVTPAAHIVAPALALPAGSKPSVANQSGELRAHINSSVNSQIVKGRISMMQSQPQAATSKVIASALFKHQNLNDMKVELVTNNSGNVLQIRGQTLPNRYMLSMSRVAIFIREIMAIPQLHLKSNKMTSQCIEFWEVLSKKFHMPEPVCRAYWSFLSRNISLFPKIAPISDLMRPFKTSVKVWEKSHRLFSKFDEIARKYRWMLHKEKLPYLMQHFKRYEFLYSDMICPRPGQQISTKVYSPKERLEVWRLARERFPEIVNHRDVWSMFKFAFRTYMEDLERGIENPWPQNWWHALAELKFLLDVRYHPLEPYYYIIHNKFNEEVQRCSTYEALMNSDVRKPTNVNMVMPWETEEAKRLLNGMLNEHVLPVVTVLSSDTAANVATPDIEEMSRARWGTEMCQEQTPKSMVRPEVTFRTNDSKSEPKWLPNMDCYEMTRLMRLNPQTYGKSSTVDKRAAWLRVAKELNTTVTECRFTLQHAIREMRIFKISDPSSKCRLAQKYYSHMADIYKQVKPAIVLQVRTPSEINQTLCEPTDTVYPERYIPEISTITCKPSLVVKNWSYAAGNLSILAQEELRVKLRRIFAKYERIAQNPPAIATCKPAVLGKRKNGSLSEERNSGDKKTETVFTLKRPKLEIID